MQEISPRYRILQVLASGGEWSAADIADALPDVAFSRIKVELTQLAKEKRALVERRRAALFYRYGITLAGREALANYLRRRSVQLPVDWPRVMQRYRRLVSLLACGKSSMEELQHGMGVRACTLLSYLGDLNRTGALIRRKTPLSCAVRCKRGYRITTLYKTQYQLNFEIIPKDVLATA